MIESAWAYVALLLLCAGLFPLLEKRTGWRIFNILPPIVLTYLLVTGLSIAGLWQANEIMAGTQKQILSWALPALMFLLLVNCDVRAIVALGPRILLGFACATVSILAAFTAVFALMRGFLPSDGWQTLASVSGGWIGGTANMVSVSQAIGTTDHAMANALLTDALCYSVWVLVLFASVTLQNRFNTFSQAVPMQLRLLKSAPASPEAPPSSLDAGLVLLWLGLGLLAGKAANSVAQLMPVANGFNGTSWTLLLATLLGLLASATPLRRWPGAMNVSNALLAVVVAALASGADFAGLGNAPLFILCGFMVLGLHALLMALAARIFRFDLALCGIASLANIGGVASAPLLAATYAPVLAPLGVLLAMLGYLIGTGGGLLLASIFQRMGAA